MRKTVNSLANASLSVVDKPHGWGTPIHGGFYKAKCILSVKFLVSSVTYIDDIPQSQSVRLAQKALQEDDVVEELSFTERRQVFFRHNPPKAPSSEAHPHNFRNAQENENTTIFCGRPQEHAVPASLFDEALCKFRHNLTVIEPTSADVRCFRNLRAAMTKMFTNEDACRVEFTQILIEWGVAPPTLRRQFIKFYHDDGDLRHPSGDFDFLYYVQEIKLEVSSGGSDPFVEAIHYWQEQIRVCFEAQKSNHQDDLLHVNFPAIILLQFGEYFTRPFYVRFRPLFQDHI